MQHILEKIKSAVSGDVFVVLVIVFVGISSFCLGRLSALETRKMPIQMLLPRQEAATFEGVSGPENEPSTVPEVANLGGQYVASKNGTKYHFPWCGGAARIAEENKIWFNSKEEAEKAGYTPAGNCKGLIDK